MVGGLVIVARRLMCEDVVKDRGRRVGYIRGGTEGDWGEGRGGGFRELELMLRRMELGSV
jgi:hypothetical protein